MEKTQAEAKKEINKIGKEQGFYMKKHKHTVNNNACYYFESRESGRLISENHTFCSAYDNVMSGWVGENV